MLKVGNYIVFEPRKDGKRMLNCKQARCFELRQVEESLDKNKLIISTFNSFSGVMMVVFLKNFTEMFYCMTKFSLGGRGGVYT